MKENVIQQKSYKFAIRIVNLYKFLIKDKKEFVLSKQILRSGTSVGANVEESIGGCSKKDFALKLSISYKEARETHYWIRILRDTGYISGKGADSLLEDCEELLKIIGAIQRTVKNNS